MESINILGYIAGILVVIRNKFLGLGRDTWNLLCGCF